MNGSGESCKTLALIDSACTHSCITIGLVKRLSLKGKPVTVTVCGINQQKTIDTDAVDVTIKPIGENTCDPFDVTPYLRDELNIGSDIIDIPRLQLERLGSC